VTTAVAQFILQPTCFLRDHLGHYQRYTGNRVVSYQRPSSSKSNT